MEEDDIKLDVVDDRESGPGAVNYDDEFADECGYSLIKALRGSSTGRQLKRAVFKVGCYQLLYSVPIFLMSCYVDNNLAHISNYYIMENGSSLIGLQFGTSILGCITGGLCLYMVKYWSTMVTNRELLVKFMWILLFFLVLYFILILCTIAKLFHVFKNMDWN